MVVGIICEYNPFHNGHLYQLSKIREQYGNDTVIVALMSGNVTQRGDLAFFEKYERAKCAVQSGVDLVLEMPFPYSSASAESYAKAGTTLAKIANVDILSFGSECGNIEKLQRVAHNVNSTDFKNALKCAIKDNKAGGYAKIQSDVYSALFGNEDIDIFTSPNNTLALEYVKSLEGGGIIPHTIKRVGSSYHNFSLEETDFSSATAIRNAILNDVSITSRVPPFVEKIIIEQKKNGQVNPSLDAMSSAILSAFLINSPSSSFAESDGGLYKRLQNTAFEVTSYSTLCAKSATKKFTDARIRRAVLYSFLGVTSSDLKEPVAYSQLLGASTCGLSHLKRVKAKSNFPILTKPSDKRKLSKIALRQKDLSDMADIIFGQALESKTPAGTVWQKTPYIEK